MSLTSLHFPLTNTAPYQPLSHAHHEFATPFTSTTFSSRKIVDFFKGTSQRLSDLHQLVNHIAMNGISHIRESFYKPAGYFSRFFSQESWDEWAENRTTLGRVVSSIADYAQSPESQKSLLQRLAPEDLIRANLDARKVLQTVNISQFPAQVDLSYLDGTNGVVIKGTNVQGLGMTIGSLGDVNGDSSTDLYIGSSSGDGYVVFGGKKFASPIDLTKLDGTNGFVVRGPFNGGTISSPMAHAGDVNGDGIDDILFSAYDGRGSCYLIFGRKVWPAVVHAVSLDSKDGVIFYGVKPNDALGGAISGTKDFNGDGIDDFMMSASGNGDNTDLPKVYVVFGHPGAWQSPFDLSKLNGTNGFVIKGEHSQDSFGMSIAALGDANGDGKPDIIIGAPGANATNSQESLGRTYVVYGHSGPFTPELEAGSLSGNTGCIFVGAPEDLDSGDRVAGFGDVNGDGIADFGIGAPDSSYGSTSLVGKAYIVFGTNETRTSPFSLADIDGTNGCIVVGTVAFSDLGTSVGPVGDINGDGLKDTAFGAPLGFVENGVGQTLVIFGHRGPWQKVITPSSLNGMNGFIANGVSSYDSSGTSIGNVQDFNGDGLDDVAIGAPGVDSGVGAGYIIYGKGQKPIQVNQPSALPVILGTVLGVGAAAALAAGATILIVRRRKKNQDPGEEMRLIQ